MASVAARWLDLDAEVTQLEAAIGQLVRQVAAPAFLAWTGVGPQSAAALIATAGDNPGRISSEAAFAALCGVSPAAHFTDLGPDWHDRLAPLRRKRQLIAELERLSGKKVTLNDAA
jgi:transposase